MQLMKLVSILTIIINCQRMIPISHQDLYIEIKWVIVFKPIWKHNLKMLPLTTGREVCTDKCTNDCT